MSDDQEKKIKQASWSAPEFVHYKKGPEWFVALFIIAAIFLVISLWMKSYIFSLIVILAAFTIYLQAQKKPREIKFVINEKGLSIDSEIHSWDDTDSFWIFKNEEMNYISLESKKILRPRLKIPLGDQDVETAKEVLKNFVREKKQTESGLDLLARRLKY